MPRLILQRFPETDDELHDFVWTVWGVYLPRVAVCPHHSAPFDAFAEAFFARAPVSIWKGSRGLAGKSFTLSTLCNTEAVCLGAQVTILGGSHTQSLRVHEISESLWESEYAPTSMLQGDMLATMTRFKDTAWIRALTASQKSARGPHPQRLRLDEIDEMDIKILEAAMGQPMSDVRRGVRVKSQVVMSSTHQYADGTMTAQLKEASDKGWPVHEWCYKESVGPTKQPGWLTEEDVAEKRAQIPEHMWRVEYDLGEPSIEGRVFENIAYVDFMFDPDEGKKQGLKDELIVIENYDKNARYVTGIDWAKSEDWTIISTWRVDCAPWRRVAWRRLGRMEWPAIISMANKRMQSYGGILVHDSTGIGSVIDDFLTHDPDLIDDVTMVGADRVDLFNDYIGAVESGSFKGPMIEYAYHEHKYVTLDDLFGKGHPPDSFVADALAWRGRGMTRPVVSPGSVTRDGNSPNRPT